MDVRVSGALELRDLALRLRKAGQVDLLAEMRRGLSRGVKPLGPAIQASAARPGYLPSGYRPVMAKALRFRTSIKTQGREVSVTFAVTAEGASHLRKVGTIDDGILRHPVFGRYRYNKHGSRRRNEWVAQKVRAGFATEAFRRQADGIRRAVIEAMHEVSKKITTKG